MPTDCFMKISLQSSGTFYNIYMNENGVFHFMITPSLDNVFAALLPPMLCSQLLIYNIADVGYPPMLYSLLLIYSWCWLSSHVIFPIVDIQLALIILPCYIAYC